MSYLNSLGIDDKYVLGYCSFFVLFNTDAQTQCSGFICRDGTCLATSERCNSQVACPDSSDERNCTGNLQHNKG